MGREVERKERNLVSPTTVVQNTVKPSTPLDS